MRVRYGKPIKVKSLLGKSNIPFSITAKNGGWGVASKNNESFKENWPSNLYSATDTIKTDIIANRVYFAFYSVTSTLQYKYARNCPKLYFSDGTVVFGNENQNKYYSALGFCCSILEPTISGSALLHIQNYNDFWTVGDTINYAFIIDITNIYESSMTAQQFYNKYNKYFSAIATGEEITIDDKTGQISIVRLPSEYQEVEYIEGTGTQYMTQWTLNKAVDGNLTVGYKFNVTEHTDAMYFSTITSNQSASQAYSLGYTGATSPLYIRWNQIANSTTEVAYTIPEVLEITRTNSVTTTLGYVSLFAHGSSGYKPWKGKIYKYWLKIDDEYLFDFIPCYRKSDNEIGLYDRIKRVFYNNIGTGTFLKGNNVNNTISCKVAGGSSDIYYGYNQLNNNIELTWYYDNSASSSGKYASHTIGSLGPVALGDKILFMFSGTNHNSDDSKVGFYCVNANRQRVYFNSYSTGNVFTVEQINSGATQIQIGTYIGPNQILDIVGYISFINLTTWFGVGKEPTTVQEFKEKFTKEYYGFCPTPIKLTRYQIEALPSYGYNQMTNRLSSSSDSGFTWTWNNNILTFTSSNPTKTYFNPFYPQYVTLGHKYFISANILSNSNNTSFQFGTLNSNIRLSNMTKGLYENIIECNYEINSSIGFASFTTGSNVGTISGYYMLIDLTDWYGAGNEPTTIEEFKATFPNKYYPYSKKRLLNKYMINKLIN